jgi:hypothetical protein
MAGTERHPWAFVPRFRRRAFGWRSTPAVTRVREAADEIKKMARVERLGMRHAALLASARLTAS